MKFTLTTVILGLSALAIANPLEERGTPKRCDKFAKKIPACALPAIAKCAQKAGCAPDDYKCVCDNQQKIAKCATPKIVKACDDAEIKQTLAASKKVCTCAEKGSS